MKTMGGWEDRTTCNLTHLFYYLFLKEFIIININKVGKFFTEKTNIIKIN